MELFLRQIDPNLALPEYKTAGAAAFDLCSRLDLLVQPGELAYVPLNVALKLPEGLWGLLCARSSLHKRGLALINGVGVVDPDFCGDNDEVQAVVHNFTAQTVELKRGERLVQLVLLPYTRAILTSVKSLGQPDRGGLGTTDNR